MLQSFHKTRAVISAAFLSLACLGLSSGQAADEDLRKATQALLAGGPTVATTHAMTVLESEPASRLAHWLHAQSLLALAGKPIEINGNDQDLIEEAKVRLEVAPPGMLPRNLVVMPQSAERNLPVLLADAERSRIYVFAARNGVPTLIDEFYTSIGVMGFGKSEEGDQRTPLGVYRIRYEIRDPRSDGFLGKMAMTLDYPNAYDTMTGRTGSGIWIHGVPDTVHVRPPKASDGCLAISNNDILRLRRHVRYQQSQIVVVPRVEWITPQEWRANADQAIQNFSAHHPREALGVFYVSNAWPLVLSVNTKSRFVREYWDASSAGGLRRLLKEPLS
jgi:hypothetical protein